MDSKDRELLQKAGFQVDCESPFEISIQDETDGETGSAKGTAAEYLLLMLQTEQVRENATSEDITKHFTARFNACCRQLNRVAVLGFGHMDIQGAQRREALRAIENIIEDYFKP